MEHDELDKMMPARSTDPGPLVPGPGPLVPGPGPLVHVDDGTESPIDAAKSGTMMSPPSEAPCESSPPAPSALAPTQTPLPAEAQNATNDGLVLKAGTQQYFGLPTTASAPNGDPCQVGDELGSYELMELLGTGGMGSVFRARHKILGREVAIKVLLPELSQHPDLVRRFFQEALAINRVHHPNVVEVTDCVFSEDRPPYIIMQYLSGQSLSRFIQTNAPLAPDVVVDLGLQICGAMEAVHARGIVHRDLKPDNVFLIPNPRPDLPGEQIVKLLDFGISKFLSPEDALVRTRTGAIIGTPEYMAPEQIKGDEIDRRTDLYSLGAILFEMLTGRPPFAAPQIGQLLLKQLGEQPVAPSACRPETPHCPIPQDLDQAVLRCLAKAKDHRVQSMGELGAILERARGACNGPVLERQRTQALVVAERREFQPRRRWPVWLAAGLGASLLVVAGGWWLSTRRRSPRAQERSAAVGTQFRVLALRVSGMAPATRAVRLASSPAGAMVLDLSSGQSLGVTPLPIDVTVGRRRGVELRLVGHVPRRLDLASDGAGAPVVALVPVPRPEAPLVPVRRTVEPQPRSGAHRPPRNTHRMRMRPPPVMTTPSRGSESATVNPFD